MRASPKTHRITRYVNDLDDAGAVTTWREGSTKVAEANLSGRLLLGSL